MIGLAVLGLAFLFFLVVAFFAAKAWHVGHVVALVFLFLGTLIMVFLTATYMKTLSEYRPKYLSSMQQLERLQAESIQLEFGEPARAVDESSLMGAKTLARIEQYDRGRVWRNLRRVPGGNGIRLQTQFWRNDGYKFIGKPDDEVAAELAASVEPVVAPADAPADDTVEPAVDDTVEPAPDAAEPPAADPAAPVPPVGPPASPLGIAKDQTVYAFLENPIALLTPIEKEVYFGGISVDGLSSSGDGESPANFADFDRKGYFRVPNQFLGQFRVTEVGDGFVTLLPEGPLDPMQARFVEPNQTTTWVLYENLPVDSNRDFADLDAEKLAGLMPLRRLNEALGQAALPQNSYDRMINEFLRDGKEANENNADPARLVMQVEFLKEHKVEVDFQADRDGVIPDDQPFTQDGRAQAKSLMQNKDTEFTVGQTAFFDLEEGKRLVGQGLAKPIKVIYRRQLRDFESSLQDFHVRMARLQDDFNVAQTDFNALQSSLASLQEQIGEQRNEQGLLQADLQGFQGEEQSLERFHRDLQKELQFLRQEIDRLSLAQSRVGNRDSAPDHGPPLARIQ